MIAVEPVLVAYLVNQLPVTNLIQTRLYPNVSPPRNETTGVGIFPHVVYYRVSTARRKTYSGTVGTNPAVQFNCLALDYDTAKAVALAIAGVLDGFAGNVQGGLVKVQGVFVDEESDDYEEPEMAEQAGIHKVQMTARVWFSGS